MLSCPSPVTAVTGPKQPTLPNPWAGQKPKSKEQPHLVVNLCYLTDRKLECHNGDEYPYELPENRTYMVPYYEILGYGLPPSDVGNPGDIYVDLTPPCRIYVRKMEAWDWWDWSKQPQWRKRFVMPRHPILSDRFLWKARGGSTSHRLSWLTKRTIKNYSAYDGCIAEAVVEMYQGLCKPSGEEEKRMEAEKTRRLLIAQLSLPTSGKRSRSPSLMCNQLSQLNSSDNITNPDTRPYKKAKLTPNGAGEETEEAEEEIGLDEARHSSSSVRCSGANLNRDDPHDSTVDVPKLSLDRDPDSKADENDVVAESMQGIGIPKDTEGNGGGTTIGSSSIKGLIDLVTGDTEGASDEGNEESAEDDESDEDSESDENEESDEDDESDKDDESDGDDEGEQHRDKATIHISEQLLDPGDVYIKVEDRETPHMRSTPQTDVDPPNAHTDDERQDAIMDGYDIVGVGEDTTLASRARADFTDPCPEDEDTIEAAGSPDALTTRAFARQ